MTQNLWTEAVTYYEEIWGYDSVWAEPNVLHDDALEAIHSYVSILRLIDNDSQN